MPIKLTNAGTPDKRYGNAAAGRPAKAPTTTISFRTEKALKARVQIAIGKKLNNKFNTWFRGLDPKL